MRIQRRSWFSITKLTALMLTLILASCKRDELIVGETDYPKDIALIMQKNCISSGCHNGKDKAGELDLTSWKSMFEGSDAGSVVIPYKPQYSTLCYFVN